MGRLAEADARPVNVFASCDARFERYRTAPRVPMSWDAVRGVVELLQFVRALMGVGVVEADAEASRVGTVSNCMTFLQWRESPWAEADAMHCNSEAEAGTVGTELHLWSGLAERAPAPANFTSPAAAL